MSADRKVAPIKEILRYLDDPWSNAACNGYAIMAMERFGLDPADIRGIVGEMKLCLDDFTIDEATQHYYKGMY